MSKFFREETKRRIVVCVTAATIATSSLVAGVTPVFAETSSDAATTTVEAPAAPAADPTSSTFTFTQDNIPGARENVPSDKFATQFVSDVSLNGTKFVGDSGSQVTAPSGLTDPDGHTVVKWVTADGSDEMAPGETREIDTLNVETFHAVWQPQDNGDDVQYRLVIDANGGHFEGGISTMYERNDFLPANMHNVRAASKVTRDGYTLVGFSRNKNDVTAPASTLTTPISIRNAEHVPGHSTAEALPGKTDEVYTLYAIWRSNTETPADPSTPADSSTPADPST
ncbi:MAG: hypothetical protein HXK50_04490, partial [Atopobium sp.]|nr:hypothetical protein [Atopobium sp.]